MRLFYTALGLGLVLGLGSGAAAANSPQGKTYHVTVYASFGNQFDDCFTFRNNGRLIIEGFGPTTYRLDELNTQPDAWQAVGIASGQYGLAFHGTVGGAGAQTIRANAVSTDGDTYILQGVLDPGCTASTAARSAGSGYRR